MNDFIMTRIFPIGPAIHFFSGVFFYKAYLLICLFYVFLKFYVVKRGLLYKGATIRDFDQKWLAVCCFSYFVINPNIFEAVEEYQLSSVIP